MNNYYTARDLAREMGQCERTARRVLAEAGIKHERGQWWRFALDREPERLQLDGVRRELARPDSARRFGCRRRRKARQVMSLQMALF